MFGFLGPIVGSLFGGGAATAAAVTVGGNLIGGALARNDARRATRKQNEYNDPANQRQRLEDAGFNPAAYLEGAGNQAQPYQSGQMGTAIAESAGIVGSFINENSAAKKRATELDKQNQELRTQLRDSVLRPRVGGIFQSVSDKSSAKKPEAASTWETDPKGAAGSDEGYRAGTKDGLFFGARLRRSGLFGDGGWFTDAYGEPAEWFVAGPSLASDVGYTLGQEVAERVGKAHSIGPEMVIGGQTYRLESPTYAKARSNARQERAERRKRPLKSLGF